MSCAGLTYWSTWLRTTVDTAQRAKSGLGEPLNGTSLEGKGGKAHSILSSHLASHGRKNSITGVTKRHPSMPLMSCLGARSAPACFGIESWHDKGASLSRSKSSKRPQRRVNVFIDRLYRAAFGEVLLWRQSLCYVSIRGHRRWCADASRRHRCLSADGFCKHTC